MRSTTGSTSPRSKSTRLAKAEPGVGVSEGAAAGPTAGAIDEKTRQAMISLVAYSFYERRGYVGGTELQDWLEAEMEVDRQLAAESSQTGKRGKA